MIDGFREQLIDWSGFSLDINYGYNKVRFPAPVPVGSRLRDPRDPCPGVRIDRLADPPAHYGRSRRLSQIDILIP